MSIEQIKKDNIKVEEPKKQIDLQRLYVKEQQCKLSRSPQVFKEEWQPEINMEMQINNSMLEKDVYEAVLQINITVKNKQVTALVAEIQQAGIFLIKGFNEAEQKAIFATYVPNILYPYARRLISTLSTDATVPPITIAPVNFDLLFKQQLAEAKKEEQAKATVLPKEAVLN